MDFLKIQSSKIPWETRSWIYLVVAVLGISIELTYFALMGDFRTYVFGVQHNFMWDPGGPYLSSGVYFFRSNDAFFHGHPGLTLQLLIGVIAEVCFWSARLFGCTEEYPTVIVKNYYWIIFAVKTAITGVHIATFFVLQRICLRFMDRPASLVAVLAYASTYPVLYYLNAIAPEPILVLCVLSGVLFVLKYLEAMAINKRGDAYLFLVAAAFWSVAGCYTKFMFGVPVTAAFLLFLFVENRQTLRLKISKQLESLSIFVGSFGILFGIFATKMNWTTFFEFWTGYSPGGRSLEAGTGVASQFSHMVLSFIKSSLLPALSPALWLPGHSKQGLFLFSEMIFFIISIYGLILLLKSHGTNRRIYYVIICICLFIAPVVLYRNTFHYYFIYMAFAAMTFAYAVMTWCRKNLSEKTKEPRRVVYALIFLMIVHYPGVVISADGKIGDIEVYNRKYSAFYQALNLVDYGETIAINNSPDLILHALGMYYGTDPKPLVDAARAFFVKATADSPIETRLYLKLDKDRATVIINR